MIAGLNQNIFLLAGGVHSGKTTRAEWLAEQCRRKGIPVSGFLAPGRFDGPTRSGFSLLLLEDGSRSPLATIHVRKGWIRHGRFYFNPETLEKGRVAVERAMAVGSGLIIIDEVGPMELAGLGWSSLLDRLAEYNKSRQLWLVREQLAGEVAERWRIDPDNILHLEEIPGTVLFEKFLGGF